MPDNEKIEETTKNIKEILDVIEVNKDFGFLDDDVFVKALNESVSKQID